MGQLEVWWQQLIGVLRDTIQAIVTYFPVVLTSIAVLIIGWLLARLLRSFVRRAIESMDWLFGRLSMRSVERSQALTRITTRATSRAISSVVYWSVLLIFAANALRILGGPLFARWTDDLLGYLPQAIGGVVIIVLSLIGGSLSRHILEQASDSLGVGQSSLIGRLAQGVIVITGVVIGIDQFGVNIEFLIQLATVTAGAVFGGIALVFALGTRQHLANLIGAHYVRKHYSPGDHIKVGAFEGRIVEISDGCVFLETAQGDVSVPAQSFSQEPFVKLRSPG